MRVWWNGRHRRLKISRLVRAGSSPATRTTINNGMSLVEEIPWANLVQ
jgi:hypothetical protein